MTQETIQSAPPEESQLLTVVHQSGLEPESQQRLIASFQPLFEQAEKWRQQVATIKVTDVSQVREMKMARESRLALREIRVKAEKARKALKEDVLRRGKAIDGIYNTLEFLIAPLEKSLLEQEQFAQRKEDERIAKVKAEREELLKPYGIDVSLFQLGLMPDEAWANLLDGTRLSHEAKQEVARKAEVARIEAENARLAEEKRIRDENARLIAEKAEREAAEKAAREKADAEAKAAQARRNALKIEREVSLAPYEVDTTFIPLGDMEDDKFKVLLTNSKAGFEMLVRQRREAAEKAETDRQSKIKADAEAKVAAERAAKEKSDLEAKAAADKAEKDRLAKQLADAEARAAKDKADREKAEAGRIAAEKSAAKKAAAAPDKDKLGVLARSIRGIPMPKMATPEGQAIVTEIESQAKKFADWIEKKARAL